MMRVNRMLPSLAVITALSPAAVLAQETFSDFIVLFIQLIQAALPVVMILALLALVWGAARFIRAAGGEERSEGRYVLFWGSIALFVMVAVWGIVAIIVQTFFSGA